MDAEDAPITALHGFTLTGAMFAELAELLEMRIVAPDLPGHGGTAVAPRSMDQVVAALADWRRSLPPGPLLGYSQGGRVALHLALTHPELFTALVVISASPGVADPDLRSARRKKDHETAARLERVGIERFLDVWLDQPVIGTTRASEPRRSRDRALRLANTAEGLAASLRAYGQGAQADLRPQLSTIALPVLALAGGADDAYVAAAEEIATLSGGRFEVVPDAGHNLILEQPEAVASSMRRFLDAAS